MTHPLTPPKTTLYALNMSNSLKCITKLEGPLLGSIGLREIRGLLCGLLCGGCFQHGRSLSSYNWRIRKPKDGFRIINLIKGSELLQANIQAIKMLQNLRDFPHRQAHHHFIKLNGKTCAAYFMRWNICSWKGTKYIFGEKTLNCQG